MFFVVSVRNVLVRGLLHDHQAVNRPGILAALVPFRRHAIVHWGGGSFPVDEQGRLGIGL
jgi:hypothetical protein